VRYICSRVKDIALNGYVYSPVYTVKIDKRDHISSTYTSSYADSAKLLAGTYPFGVSVDINGGSPITLVE
jgi:hypothetical protein